MKINKYSNPALTENYIDLYYSRLDEETEAVLGYLESFGYSITGKTDELTRPIYPREIFYCEIVDRKCFVYLKDSVWQVDLTIQDFTEKYASSGLVRISKSMAVNVYLIKCLKADVNMRMNILLNNGETVVLNRAYKSGFFKFLEQLTEGKKQ